MQNPNRVAGTLFFKVDGTQYKAKGNFEYDLGAPKREAITGPDGVHGYKEMPKAPYVTGAITNDGVPDVDRNGDGFDDLIIGASGTDAGLNNRGAAHVVFGSANPQDVDASQLAVDGLQGFSILGDTATRLLKL